MGHVKRMCVAFNEIEKFLMQLWCDLSADDMEKARLIRLIGIVQNKHVDWNNEFTELLKVK